MWLSMGPAGWLTLGQRMWPLRDTWRYRGVMNFQHLRNAHPYVDLLHQALGARTGPVAPITIEPPGENRSWWEAVRRPTSTSLNVWHAATFSALADKLKADLN